MHFIPLHIGDYTKDTARFKPEQHGIYFSLLKAYYTAEAPLPADLEELEYLTGAETPLHKKALAFVLKRCFHLDESAKVYRQKRADIEIAKYQRDCLHNRFAILCRHWKKVNPHLVEVSPTFESFTANPSLYYNDDTGRIRVYPTGTRPVLPASGAGITNQNHNQEPETGNQKPVTKILPPYPLAGGMEREAVSGLQADFDASKNTLSPEKKEGGRGPGNLAEAGMRIPDGWSEARGMTFFRWVSHRTARSLWYSSEQWEKVIKKTARLTDTELEACVTAMMAAGKDELKTTGYGSREDLFARNYRRTKPASYPEWARAIYAAYPRDVGRDAAMKAIARAVKRAKLSPEELLVKVQAYTLAVRSWPEDQQQFVPDPAKWFDAGSFNDNPDTWLKAKPEHAKKEGTVVLASAPKEALEPEGWREIWPELYPFEAPKRWLDVPTANRDEIQAAVLAKKKGGAA